MKLNLPQILGRTARGGAITLIRAATAPMRNIEGAITLRTGQVAPRGAPVPTNRFRRNEGEFARYTPHRDIEYARRLWSTDGYASEVINNIVDFAAGDGAKVIHDSPAWDMAWKNWEWNRSNPRDRASDLFQTAVLRLIRDGNILDVKRIAPDGFPYLRMLNPAYLYGTTGLGLGYQGITIDDTGKPVEYLYYPRRTYVRSEGTQRYRADQVIHVFKTEWDEYQLMGETWLRRALQPLDELDNLDASMVFSVVRAAKTPSLYKIPLHYAFAYTRELDAQGNPVNPDETVEQQAAAARQILERTISAPGEDGIIPDDVEFVPRPFQATVNDAARLVLLERVCRGVGISMAAALGKFGTGGYLSNRFAVAQDEKFYSRTQTLGERYLHEVIGWWQDVMANTSMELRRAPRGYKIELPVFPMANLQQDVMAMKGLRDLEAVSPQSTSRRYGYDPYAELAETVEWEVRKREMMMSAGLITEPVPADDDPEDEPEEEPNG